MIQNVSEIRSITSLLASANHKSPHMRAKVAAYLDDSLEEASGKLSMSGHGGLIEKIFKAAAGFLEEGSLDTRTHGKRLIWNIKHWLSSRSSFNRLVEQLGSESKQKKVLEVVESTNGPPPPPPKVAARLQVILQSNAFSRSNLAALNLKPFVCVPYISWLSCLFDVPYVIFLTSNGHQQCS